MIASIGNRATMGRIIVLGFVLAALMAACLAFAANPAQAATTITVNAVGDKNDLDFPGGVFDGSSDGKCFTGEVLVMQGEECTLRAAIQEANQTPGADTIDFNIPTIGVATISPASQLPTITGPVTIDGYTQFGAKPNTLAVGSDAVLKIELSGAKLIGADGLVIEAANSTVKGLVINQWQQLGVRIDGSAATGNKVTGNFIGTDVSGTKDLGNLRGVYIPDAPDNTIGGATAAERNVISANDENGVSIDAGAGDNKVMGNYIGTDASGTKDLGNDRIGVNTEGAPNTTIGGTTAGERNVISGNNLDGVSIFATGNKVAGNYIGTDASGTKNLGNGDNGVVIGNGPDNVIGGPTAGAHNVISGNAYGGVYISGAAAKGNKVTGNYIGTDASGQGELGNYRGVYIEDAPNNIIGGATAAERNVISANGESGVQIAYAAATGNRVAGNYIGTDRNGTDPLGNYGEGVVIFNASTNTVGGTTAGARNVISANNDDGVLIFGDGSTGNRVVGNYVGTDASGTKDLGNTYNGVYINDAPDNTVGGATTGERNVISANDRDGVLISDAGAGGNRIAGNYVGTDASGTEDLGNRHNGTTIVNAPNNAIGGAAAGERNVVSGNNGEGILINGSDATGNKVAGNYVGTDKNSTAPLGNSLDGVYIFDASNNTVGGTSAGARNVISANGYDGVAIYGSSGNSATANRILSNSIFSNGELGIDLSADGPTANDTGDADTGPNNLQNFLVITSVGKKDIKGTLNSKPSTTYTVQLFSNPQGTDEGKTLLGQKSVTTDGSGNASFSVRIKKILKGQNVTATATDPEGNTSEFSAPKTR